jgi:hypothetical protein
MSDELKTTLKIYTIKANHRPGRRSANVYREQCASAVAAKDKEARMQLGMRVAHSVGGGGFSRIEAQIVR